MNVDKRCEVCIDLACFFYWFPIPRRLVGRCSFHTKDPVGPGLSGRVSIWIKLTLEELPILEVMES